MPTYRVPVDDYQFLLHDFLRIRHEAALPGASDLSPEFTAEILEAAARFHEREILPIGMAGDREGARIERGVVSTPSGFPQAWKRFAEGGWHRLTLPESIGGAGLPRLLRVAIGEMGTATGHSFMMYGGFCASAAYMLSRVGDPWMHEHVVPRLVAGDWTATMCLTESHCGTDLRQLRTRAEPNGDGSWRITGSKIFISGGEHDLTENIVHVVLAKVPDADGRVPDGLGAVNVFLVSKRDIDPSTGALGGANRVAASSIENKMGIEGSATCVMNFDGARGWRLAGEGGPGSSSNMAAMFILMNYARLGTAVSGIAYAELAYQNAAAYARGRLSGRAPSGPRNPGGPADPLIVHADVRRMLLDSRAFAEGARALAVRVGLLQDLAVHAADAEERQRAHDLLELMTPVMKAYFTDRGFEAANACLQVLGGHGYIRDYEIEQMVRNARIGQIYEGANGIQAYDLAARKLAANGGRAAQTFAAAIRKTAERLEGDADLRGLRGPLIAGLGHLESALAALRRRARDDVDALPAAAYDLMTMFGIVAVGWTWADLAIASTAPSTIGRSAEQRRVKRQLAALWMARQMPLVGSLAARVETPSDVLMALGDDEV